MTSWVNQWTMNFVCAIYSGVQHFGGQVFALPPHHSHEIGGFFRQFHLPLGHHGHDFGVHQWMIFGIRVYQRGIRRCCWVEWGSKDIVDKDLKGRSSVRIKFCEMIVLAQKERLQAAHQWADCMIGMSKGSSILTHRSGWNDGGLVYSDFVMQAPKDQIHCSFSREQIWSNWHFMYTTSSTLTKRRDCRYNLLSLIREPQSKPKFLRCAPPVLHWAHSPTKPKSGVESCCWWVSKEYLPKIQGPFVFSTNPIW